MKARGDFIEEQLYSFFNLATGCGRVVNFTPRAFYPRDRDPVPIV
jgi:hypothetical protein